MAMLESPERTTGAVDTYGLPNYRVTAIKTETCGGDVLILAGDKRFGQVQWTHLCTISAAALIEVYPQFEQAVMLAMRILGMTDGAPLHH